MAAEPSISVGFEKQINFGTNVSKFTKEQSGNLKFWLSGDECFEKDNRA